MSKNNKMPRQSGEKSGLLLNILDIISKGFDNITEEDRQTVKALLEQNQEMYGPGEATESDWTGTHPNHTRCGCDKFYARLVNTILDEFRKLNLQPNMPVNCVYASAMSIAAYLEDIKSDLGVWNAVRSLYKERYGNKIPFYEVTDDYYDDDLNVEDIRILIWQAFNRCGNYEGRTFSPFSMAVFKMAEVAYGVLVDNFDDAPVANRVNDYINKVFKKGDYYELRALGLWLSTDNPLTAVPFIHDHIENETYSSFDVFSEYEVPSGSSTLEASAYAVKMKFAWLKYMGLTGCPTSTLLARIAQDRGFGELAEKIRGIKAEPMGIYIKEAVGKTTVTFRNELDEKIDVLKKSFSAGTDFANIKSGMMAITGFGEDYYVSGMCMMSEDMPNKLDEIIINKPAPAMLEAVDRAVARNNGRRVFYCKTIEEVSEVLDNELLPKYATIEGEEEYETPDNLLLLLSSTVGPIIKADSCGVFKDKANPFYIRWGGEQKGMHAWGFISDNYLPDDVIEYIVEHKLLPSAFMRASQGKAFGKKLVQDNMDFLFHFYRVDSHEPYDPDDDDYEDDDYDYDYEDEDDGDGYYD